MSINAHNFNCNKCPNNYYCDDTNPAPFPKWQVKHRGITILESKTCLLPMLEGWCLEFFKLYRHYKNGIFPTNDGFLEQSNYYIEAMELIEDIYGEQKES